jgi:NADH-quinone oxidoreductase subunit M
VPPPGPFKAAWKAFDVGGKEYAAMKLTLMLLVGSAAILVGDVRALLRGRRQELRHAHAGEPKFPRDADHGCSRCCGWASARWPGVFPFHTWSPDGHASAPTAVSMLHAGVLMKLGAFGVMRVGMMLLPEGARLLGPRVGAVAAVNVLYGALSAMSQKDLKYVIAYSSVSHMGVVMLGAATLTPTAGTAPSIQMFAHGIMTGLFFALVGLVYERAHTRGSPRWAASPP